MVVPSSLAPLVTASMGSGMEKGGNLSDHPKSVNVKRSLELN